MGTSTSFICYITCKAELLYLSVRNALPWDGYFWKQWICESLRMWKWILYFIHYKEGKASPSAKIACIWFLRYALQT